MDGLTVGPRDLATIGRAMFQSSFHRDIIVGGGAVSDGCHLFGWDNHRKCKDLGHDGWQRGNWIPSVDI